VGRQPGGANHPSTVVHAGGSLVPQDLPTSVAAWTIAHHITAFG